MTWITVLVVVAVVFGLIALQIDDWGRDWTQNFAALEEDAPKPELRPVRLSMDVASAMHRVKKFVDAQSAWNWVDVKRFDPPTNDPPMVEDTAARIELTRTSRLFRFVDDVTVMLRDNQDGSVTLYATSQSRVGKGDLGQNPRNLIQLVEGVQQ